MATLAAATAERVRIMSAHQGVVVILDPVAAEILVKDSRTSTENQAYLTDSYSPGSWQRYEVGSTVTYKDSEVTFA